MKRILLIGYVLLAAMLTQSFAQERRVTGTVTSHSDRGTLPGVQVVVKGTTMGTVTDINGKYDINVPAGATLVFQFVGMATEEVEVGDRNVINVALIQDIATLQEVVVTGLGAATDRRKVAISVETVSGDQLTKVPNKTLDAALMGRIPGALIQSTSGQPGQQANIILRGINTLGTTQPLILIDGVEISNSNNSMGTGNVSSRFADLDLSNIERVEVVQGAAAATIYGAQGANGVIQIFTKKGRKGQKTDIRFSSTYSVDNALRGNLKFAENHYFPIDSLGFILGANGQPLMQDTVTGFWNMPSQAITAATLNDKPYVNETFDHMDQYFKKNAGTFNNSLNITGSTEKIDFAFGLSAIQQESVVYGELNRYNLTANVGSEIFKNFTLRSYTQLINSDNTTGGINNRNNIYSGLSGALMVPHFVDLLWVNHKGDPAVIHDNTQNSVAPFYSYKYRSYKAETNRIIQGVSANYKVTRFLELDYKFGLDHFRYDYQTFIKNQTLTPAPGYGIFPLDGELVRSRIAETRINSIISGNLKLDFEKDFGMNIPLQSTTLFAYDFRQEDYNRVTGTGTKIDVNPPFTLNAAGSKTSDEFISRFVTFGWLINQKFDYGLIGGFSAGYRADYSSEFGEASKPTGFPRFDAYLRLNELLGIEALSELKIRAAHGQAGIQPSRYARQFTLPTEYVGENTYYFLRQIARNAALEVERTKETEFGVDYGFYGSSRSYLSKASGSVIVWQRGSEGTIYDIAHGPSLGTSGLLTNGIDLNSKGIQLSLNLDLVSLNNFNWSFTTNFSKGVTMVDRISNGKSIVIGSSGSGVTVIMEGEPVGALFGFKPVASLDEVDSKGNRYIPEASVDNYEVVLGMVVNKANKQVLFTSEQFKIGDNTPDFTLSFFNDFVIYKNLSISTHLDWVYGADVYNQTRQWLYRDRLHSDFDREVTINGETGAFVAFWNSLYNTNRANSFFVEDASFLRLRSLSLSYDFGKLLNLPYIKGFVVSVSGNNLFTITNYTGLDPEASGTNLNNPLNRGTDLWAFPNMKTYNVGINVNF